MKLERLQTPDGVIEVRLDPVIGTLTDAVERFAAAIGSAGRRRCATPSRRQRTRPKARRNRSPRCASTSSSSSTASRAALQAAKELNDAVTQMLDQFNGNAWGQVQMLRSILEQDRPRVPQFRRSRRPIGRRHGGAGSGLQRHPDDDLFQRGNPGDRDREVGGPRRRLGARRAAPKTRGDRLMSGSIARQTTSYRHGLVLGLTMAEIMLLLVFSLLIAIGVSLATERVQREEVMRAPARRRGGGGEERCGGRRDQAVARASRNSSTGPRHGRRRRKRWTSSGAPWWRATRSSKRWSAAGCRGRRSGKAASTSPKCSSSGTRGSIPTRR